MLEQRNKYDFINLNLDKKNNNIETKLAYIAPTDICIFYCFIKESAVKGKLKYECTPSILPYTLCVMILFSNAWIKK